MSTFLEVVLVFLEFLLEKFSVFHVLCESLVHVALGHSTHSLHFYLLGRGVWHELIDETEDTGCFLLLCYSLVHLIRRVYSSFSLASLLCFFIAMQTKVKEKCINTWTQYLLFEWPNIQIKKEGEDERQYKRERVLYLNLYVL